MYWKIGVNIGIVLVVGLIQSSLPVQAQLTVEEVPSAPEVVQEVVVEEEAQTQTVGARSLTLSGQVGSLVTINFADFANNFGPEGSGGLMRVTVLSLPAAGELQIAGAPLSPGVVLESNQVLVYQPTSVGTYEFGWRGEGEAGTGEAVVTLSITEEPRVEEVPSVPDLTVTTRADRERAFEFGELGLETLVGIRVVRAPENGQLIYDGQAELPRVIRNEDIERLVYRPNPEYAGPDGFGYVGVRGDEMESANVGVVSITVETKQTGTPTTPTQPAPEPQPKPETPPTNNPTSPKPQPRPTTSPKPKAVSGTPGKKIKPMLAKVRVANPLSYALENVQVRLATNSKKTPFAVGSYRLKGSGVVVQEVDTPGELKLTLARIEPGEEVEISNLVETPEDEEVDVEKTVQVDTVEAAGAVVELANLTPATDSEEGLQGLAGIETEADEEVSWKLQWLVGITLLILGAGVVLNLWHKKFVGAEERRQLPG